MAIIVTLRVDESSVPTGRQANFVVLIENTGSAAVNLRNVAVSYSGAGALVGQPTMKPADPSQILPTSGSLPVPVSGPFVAGRRSSDATTQKTEVALTATVTTREVGTTTDVNTASNPVSMAVQPITYPPTPAFLGDLDFTSNNNTLYRIFGFLRTV